MEYAFWLMVEVVKEAVSRYWLHALVVLASLLAIPAAWLAWFLYQIHKHG